MVAMETVAARVTGCHGNGGYGCYQVGLDILQYFFCIILVFIGYIKLLIYIVNEILLPKSSMRYIVLSVVNFK